MRHTLREEFWTKGGGNVPTPKKIQGIRGGARWGEPKPRKSVKGQSSRVSVCGCECVFAYADVWVG